MDYITISTIFILGVLCGVSVFWLRVYYIKAKNLETLMLAGYTKEGSYYNATDNWYTKDLASAVERAQLEIKIKEFGLKKPAEDFIKKAVRTPEEKEEEKRERESLKTVDIWLSKKA